MSSCYCMRCNRCGGHRFAKALRLMLPAITGEPSGEVDARRWLCNRCAEALSTEWSPPCLSQSTAPTL